MPIRASGSLTLIVSAEHSVRFARDPSMGWRRLVDDVRVLSLPGNHHTCVAAHAGVLAELLRGCLERAER